MIDRYLIRYFLAVVDQGSFSRASRQANVSQPTLSVGIAKLESLLGETLFERSTRRISLTSAGARFLPPARRSAHLLSWMGGAAAADPRVLFVSYEELHAYPCASSCVWHVRP